MSSDGGIIESKIEDMSKKINLISKQIKQILEKLNEKVEIAETVGKGRGRVAGKNFDEKRENYLDMLNSKRIREPKPETMEYYKIKYDKENENYVYFWKIFHNIITKYYELFW